MKKLFILFLLAMSLTSCMGHTEASNLNEDSEPITYIQNETKCITESSGSIRAYIMSNESFSDKAVWDYKAYSIGYGHTGSDVKADDTITKEEAIDLFNADIKVFDNAVVKFAEEHNITLTQNQFDALVSFVYNLGQNSLNRYEELGYDLINYLVTGEYTEEQMIEEWTSYCHAGGVELQGLKNRRIYEVNLFLNCEE